MLEVSQIEVPDRAVFAAGSEDVCVAEADVVHCRVVRDQLRRHRLLLNVPDRACRINRRGSNNSRSLLIPVKTGDRGAILRIGLNM